MRLHMDDGGKVEVCCFEATMEEQQAENLHWFCSFSSCTAIPRSCSCAGVPILGVPARWEKRPALQKIPHPNETEEESKAKQTKRHPSPPQKCKRYSDLPVDTQ